MAFLGRKELLQKEKLQIVKVDLGNDEFVCVTEMTARAKDRWEKSMTVESKGPKGEVVYSQTLEDFRAKLACATVCDEEGNLIFDPKDAATLSQNISAAKLSKIIRAAQKLNLITDEDKEAIVKNLEAIPADNSNSDSVKKSE
jgi:hypothetical protein